MRQHFDKCVSDITNKKLSIKRKQQRVKRLDPASDDDENGPELFQA